MSEAKMAVKDPAEKLAHNRKAEQWLWSSHRAMAGLAPVPAWLATDFVLGRLGAGNGRAARRRYREFIEEGRKEREGDVERMMR